MWTHVLNNSNFKVVSVFFHLNLFSHYISNHIISGTINQSSSPLTCSRSDNVVLYVYVGFGFLARAIVPCFYSCTICCVSSYLSIFPRCRHSCMGDSNAIYSARQVESATVGCFFVFHDTSELSWLKAHTVACGSASAAGIRCPANATISL